MAVEQIVAPIVYQTGQVLAWTWLVYEPEHLVVIRTDADGVSTELDLNVDYSVPGNAMGRPTGGSITLAEPIGAGETVTIDMAVPALQPLHLTSAGAFDPRNIETALDLLTQMMQGNARNFARALLLGLGDVDGEGAYEARGNRIEDLGRPIAGQDAVTREYAEQLLQAAAMGLPTILPQSWVFQTDAGLDQYDLPGATLAAVETYLVFIDGVYQHRDSYTIDLGLNPPVIIFDHTGPTNMTCVVLCHGYSLPVQPISTFTFLGRPIADVSLIGVEIVVKDPGGPSFKQRCMTNSAGDPEWVTICAST